MFFLAWLTGFFSGVFGSGAGMLILGIFVGMCILTFMESCKPPIMELSSILWREFSLDKKREFNLVRFADLSFLRFSSSG